VGYMNIPPVQYPVHPGVPGVIKRYRSVLVGE